MWKEEIRLRNEAACLVTCVFLHLKGHSMDLDGNSCKTAGAFSNMTEQPQWCHGWSSLVKV